MKALHLWLILLCTSLFAIWGCRNRVAEPAAESPPPIIMQIVLDTDTLRFVPGDSAKTCGVVIVRDGDMHPVAGVHVYLYVEQQSLGFLEFTGPLGDTTDANGRVYFCYRAKGRAGHDVILAICGMQSVRQDVIVQQSTDIPPRQCITVIPDVFYVRNDGREDSALVIICTALEDTAHNGIPGISLPLRASGGRLAPIPRIDSTGCARFYWYSNNEPPGRYWIGTRTCSTFVRIIDHLPPMHRDSL